MGAAQCLILGEWARVAGKILGWSELGGVDKNGGADCSEAADEFAGAHQQGSVSGVESPHGGDKHEGAVGALKGALECRQGAYRFQKGSGKGRGLEYWDTGRLGDSPSRVAGGLWRGFYMYNSEENHFHQLTSKRSSAIQSHSVFNPI